MNNSSLSPSSRHELVLYHHCFSFFSQKVLMALHEKNIDFEPAIVDITKGEQYKKEFISINPRGEIPVLVHRDKIIPDSTRILNYLEKQFNKAHPPLVEVSDDPFIVKTVEYFCDLIEDIPVSFITIGCLIYTDLCGQQKWPFVLPVRNWIKDADKNRSKLYRQLAEKFPKAKAVLLYKSQIQEKKQQVLQEREKFELILEKLFQSLDEVETQLRMRKDQDGWLCCESFTLADVHLAVLLARFNSIGLDISWLNGKRPYIEKYFEKVQKRESFKKMVPSAISNLKVMAKSSPPEIIYTTASVGIVITLLYYVLKSH